MAEILKRILAAKVFAKIVARVLVKTMKAVFLEDVLETILVRSYKFSKHLSPDIY